MKHLILLSLAAALSTGCNREEPKPEQGVLPDDTASTEDTGGIVDCDASLSSPLPLNYPLLLGSSVMLLNCSLMKSTSPSV